MPAYPDTEFFISDTATLNRFFRFDCTALMANTITSVVMPGLTGTNVTLPMIELAQTWSAINTFSAQVRLVSSTTLLFDNSVGTTTVQANPSLARVITLPDLTCTLASNVFTTLGDIVYRGASLETRLAGSTSATKKYLSQTGNGTISAAPSWDQPASTDLSDTAGLARLASANTFTTIQTIAPITDVCPLHLTLPTGASGNAFEIYDTDLGGLSYKTQNGGGTYVVILGIGPVGFANSLAIQAKSTVSTNRTYSIDNSIASTDFMMTGGTQSSSGAKTFSGASFFTGAGGANMDGTTARFIFRDQTTTSKTASLDLSGISTSTHRALKVLDSSGMTIPAVGNGGSAPSLMLGSLALTGQTAAIAAANLTNASPAGFYEVSYYLSTTTANVTDTGTLSFQVSYTDRVGATNQTSAGTLALAATTTGTTALKGTFLLYLASGNITYQTNLTGTQTTSRYSVDAKIKFLG